MVELGGLESLATALVSAIKASSRWTTERGANLACTGAVQLHAPTIPDEDFVLKISIGFQEGWNMFEKSGFQAIETF